MSFLLLALNRSLMQFRCHKDIAFGIIFLRSPVDPSPFSHAGHAVQLVKKSKLESKILFATFASEGTSTFKYSFDGGVPSFQETSSPQASQMFDVALGRPVRLGLLLEELQTISEGAVNRKGTGLRSFLSRLRLSKEAEGPRPKWGVRKD